MAGSSLKFTLTSRPEDRLMDVPSTSNGNLSNGFSSKRSFESVDGGAFSDKSPVFKKRTLSAVRKFPRGCGRFAPRITALRTGEVMDSQRSMDGSEEMALVKIDDSKRLNVAVEPEQPKSLGSSTENGVEGVPENSVQKDNFLELEPKPVQNDKQKFQLDSVQNEELGLEISKVASSDQEEPLQLLPIKTDISIKDHSEKKSPSRNVSASSRFPSGHDRPNEALGSEASGVSSPVNQQAPLPPSVSIAEADSAVEDSAKKKFPSRNLSASRHFPYGCGRNVPKLTIEERMRFMASKNRKSTEGKPLEEEELNKLSNAKAVQADKPVQCERIESMSEKKDNVLPKKKKPKEGKPLEEEDKSSCSIRTKPTKLEKIESTPKIRDNKDVGDRGKSIKEGAKMSRPIEQSPYMTKKSHKKDGVRVKHLATKSEKLKKGDGFQSKITMESAEKSDGQVEVQDKEEDPMDFYSDKVIVQALMAAPNCPWMQGKGSTRRSSLSLSGNKPSAKKEDPSSHFKPKSSSKSKDKGLKRTSDAENSKQKTKSKATMKVNSSTRETDGEATMDEEENSSTRIAGEAMQLFEGEDEDGDSLLVGPDYEFGDEPRELSMSLIPFGVGIRRNSSNQQEEVATRSKVRETLRLFQALYRKLLQDDEAKRKNQDLGQNAKRLDLQAARLLKDKNMWVNSGKQILGPVPGVEVGDEFHYRIELCIVGLHRQIQAGIDYIKRGNITLATSIVSSGGYAGDVDDSSDVLVYSGHGGNHSFFDKKLPAENQKLERGNLALKTSMDEQIPVRVIRGFKETRVIDPQENSRGKVIATYTYDGLYQVEKFWTVTGSKGCSTYQFQLRRLPGQPMLAWKLAKQVGKSKKLKRREGVCIEDISEGKEAKSVCSVNTIDDELPTPFKYITKMIYPPWYKLIPGEGCECTNGCSDSETCACAVKNGGELPFNRNGAIVEAKPIVYECGPKCRCPLTCHNRVSQHGIKFPLEIFKTENRGWGVRSMISIPSGSFICEYTGELLRDTEAEQRTGNDEYLFDIGHNYSDHALWDGLSTLIPDMQLSTACDVVEDVGYTIDAAEYGNVGRFINHSCSPNLYAQNVLYDHHDKTMPHIMLFAAENIPPLQELTYHYNYTLDQVRDSDGNIKKKDCYCGSHECSGRLY
ncbi:hypothetical protein AMTRI_Chr03g146110 [Amborella trichopoda]